MDCLKEIECIRFENVDELFVKKASIREKYRNLDYNIKEIYKWYFFYQLCLVKNPLKELLWDYLNGKDVSEKVNFAYIDFCNKRDSFLRR